MSSRKAREITGDFVPTDGPFTVADALAAYLTKYSSRRIKPGIIKIKAQHELTSSPALAAGRRFADGDSRIGVAASVRAARVRTREAVRQIPHHAA